MNIETDRGECEHGRLRRSCPECHAAEDIAELSDELAALDAECVSLKAERDDWREQARRLRAALEAAPTPTEPGAYNMGTVMQKEWYNFRHWFLTTRAEALK